MGEKMQHAPIFFTIGQVRFNPILDMHRHIEALQTEFRKYSFSGFNEEDVSSIQVETSSIPPRIVTNNQKRWRFTNSKKTGEIILSPNSVLYRTTQYETSEEFMARLLHAIRIVHKEVNLDYVEQIGFRTLDAIRPDEEHPLDVLIKPELLGFYSSTDDDIKQSILEGTSQIGSAHFLVRRVVIIHGGLGIPIDLMPISLEIDARFKSINGWHAVLDTDYAAREQFDFDIDSIKGRLQEVKEGASRAFHGAVSKVALELWR
jgi:uncharacterized protein (TIGR04255 family)